MATKKPPVVEVEPVVPADETLEAAEDLVASGEAAEGPTPDTAALEAHADLLFRVAVNSAQAGELYAALRAGKDAVIDRDTHELVILD